MSELRETIAKNILYYRKKAKLSQKEVAEQLGVSIPAVSKWENGTNSIGIEILFDLCQLLGVPVNKIYGVDGEVEQNDILEKYNALDGVQEAGGSNPLTQTIRSRSSVRIEWAFAFWVIKICGNCGATIRQIKKARLPGPCSLPLNYAPHVRLLRACAFAHHAALDQVAVPTIRLYRLGVVLAGLRVVVV